MLKYTIPRWIYIHRNSISIFEIWTNHTSHFNWMKRLKQNAERKKFDCTKKKRIEKSIKRRNEGNKNREFSLSLSANQQIRSLDSFPPLSKDVLSLNSINSMAPQFPAPRSSNRVPLISPPPFHRSAPPPFPPCAWNQGWNWSKEKTKPRPDNFPRLSSFDRNYCSSLNLSISSIYLYIY